MTTERCEVHNRDLVCPTVEPSLANYVKPYCPVCLEESVAKERSEEKAQELAEQERLQKKRELEKYSHLQLGKRFESATFVGYRVEHGEEQERVKTTCQRYAITFPARLAAGDSLILSGNPGTGKNHLAAAIAKDVSAQGFMVLHTSSSWLLRDIKETWRKGSERTEREAIKFFIKPDLLIIDEVGMQFGSPSEQLLFMDVLNGRYMDLRPTIMLSMFSVESLEELLGKHIIERFKEGKSSICKFDWVSYRLKSQNKGS